MGKSQTVTVPIRTYSEANLRQHHQAKARRVRRQRKATLEEFWLESLDPLYEHPCADSYLVDLVRIAPRKLDDDNLQSSLKAVRDEVARWLGYDDAPTSPIQWRYDQRKGEPKEYAVEITITADPEACPTCGRI